MRRVFGRPSSMKDRAYHYCGGCGHGVVHRIIGETIDKLGIAERTIGIAPVGCAVLAYNYFQVDFTEAAHGRPPAVATGIKRALPDHVVFCYQGDGDLAAIGTAESIHAAARGENITVIFVNNAVYGMTGGQMAPTTLLGQKTLTTPRGREHKVAGYPIRVCELLTSLDGVCYLERTAVNTPKNIFKTKKAILKAFQNQLDQKGFSLVEVLSSCPTNWGMTPLRSNQWVEEEMMRHYPLGVYKSKD